MTDDEREALAAWLEREAYATPQARVIAAQLRADGERIKALEAAMEEALHALRSAPHYPLPIVDVPPVPPYGELVANRLRGIYLAARERQGE